MTRSYPVTEGAMEALKSYQQADEDGVMVLVSRQALDEAIRFLASANEAPTKEDFARWSRVWHDTCETMVTLLGLPGSGSPQELFAQVQAYVGSRAVAQGAWQPIETAPKDNTRIMLWYPWTGKPLSFAPPGFHYIAVWTSVGDEYDPCWRDPDDFEKIGDGAALWMPLPVPSSLTSTHYRTEEITGAEMDAIEAAAIAGTPLSSTEGK